MQVPASVGVVLWLVALVAVWCAPQKIEKKDAGTTESDRPLKLMMGLRAVKKAAGLVCVTVCVLDNPVKRY